MSNSIWLVEIRVKDWVHIPEGESRVFAYEEVLAEGEVDARLIGFQNFKTRTVYEPVMRHRFKKRGLALSDYCAPDAVQL